MRKSLLLFLILTTLIACGRSDEFSVDHSDIYLGIENGTMALNDEKAVKYLDYLGLDVNAPTVIGLFYANNTYLAVTEDQAIYISNDLVNWKKIQQKVGKDFTYNDILSDPPRGFLLIVDNKFYFSKDGEEWELIKGMGSFFSKKPDYRPKVFFKNKIISTWDKKAKSKKYGKYEAVYLSKTLTLANDGDFIFKIRSNEKNHGMSPNDISISFDGVKWKNTGKSILSYSSDIRSLLDFDNKKIIEIYSYDCGYIYNYFSYFVNNNKVVLETPIYAEGKVYYFKGALTPQQGFFNLCVNHEVRYDSWEHEVNSDINYNDTSDWDDDEWDDYDWDYDEELDFYEPDDEDWDDDDEELDDDEKIEKSKIVNNSSYLDITEQLGFNDDVLIIQDFIGNNFPNTISYAVANGKFYFLGKYGGIIEVDENFNQRWVGLYPRITLSREEMADPLIGGQIGIIEKNDVLWYSNSAEVSSFAKGVFRVFSSSDGKSWKYEFASYSRVPWEQLGEEH